MSNLLKNHPFIDGNKRVSFMALVLFLEINRYQLFVEDGEVELLIYDVLKGVKNFEDVVGFLQLNCKMF